MRVPQDEQSVGIEAINAPEIKAPEAVPGQFGEQVGEALKGAGEALSGVSNTLMQHIQRQNYWKQEAKIASDHENIRTTFQDMATSTDPVVVQSKFSDTAPLNASANASQATSIETQPKGYLNRLGFNADGATASFEQDARPVVNQYLQQYKNNPRLYAQAQRQFGQLYASYYDQVSKHEATQYRLGMNDTFHAQTMSFVTQASSSNTPDSLKVGIDNITAATTKQYKYRGADQVEIDNNVQKNVGDAVSKSVINTLTSTGNLEQAKSLLDSAKDQIPAERYDKIDSMLTTGYQRMEQQAHVASVQKTIGGQADLLTGLAQGKAGWMNIDDVAKLAQQGVISDKFAKAYTDVIASEGKYQPREDNNINAGKYIDSIYNAKSQTELHDHLISMMQEHKQMSQDEMAMLINSAMKRSGSLPLDLKLSPHANPDPKQLNIDAGARAVVNFGRRNNLTADEMNFMYSNYYNAASKGASVPVAVDQATKQYAIAKYPALATVEGTPTAIASPEGGIKYLHFNSNTTVAPSRIWNPKTRVFDVNTNRAKLAKGDKQQ